MIWMQICLTLTLTLTLVHILTFFPLFFARYNREVVLKETQGDLEARYRRALKQNTLAAIEDILVQINGEYGRDASIELVRGANTQFRKMTRLGLLRELKAAARTVHPIHMTKTIEAALANNFDPSTDLIARLELILDQPEARQCILRARGSLENFDEMNFRRAIVAFSRFEVRRIPMRDSRMIVGVLLQHASMHGLRAYYNGEDFAQSVHVVQIALQYCRLLMVETGAMQLARLLLSFASGRSTSGEKPNVSTDLGVYIESAKLDANITSVHYLLDRFPHLGQSNSKDKKGFLSSFGFGNKKTDYLAQSRMSELLSFQQELIKKPLLSTLSKQDQDCTTSLFSAVQTVMGDRKMKKMINYKGLDGKPMISREHADVAFVAEDLCNAGRKRPPLRDELYIQLCKQISGNPSIHSRNKGWLLFSLYLHAFPPSRLLSPYLKNFITFASASEAVTPSDMQRAHKNSNIGDSKDLKANLKNTDKDKDDKSQEKEAIDAYRQEQDIKAHIVRIASYCLRILSMLDSQTGPLEEADQSYESDDDEGFSSKTVIKNHLTEIYNHRYAIGISRQLTGCILGGVTVSFDVVLMTGSVHHFTVDYGDIDTVFSILPHLYTRLVGTANLKSISGSDAFPARSSKQNEWKNWLLQVFRGFAFYELEVGSSAHFLCC